MTNQEIIQKAMSPGMDAKMFNKWLDANDMDYEWLDVTLTDLNDGYYNILVNDEVNILFIDGKYQND